MLLIFETHPVQYHAPVYRMLAQEFGIPIKVIYGADFSVRGYKDIEFGQDIKWDLDLLSGYSYQHLAAQRSQAGQPRPNNYDEVSGFGVKAALAKNQPAVVLALGYSNAFDRQVIWQTLTQGAQLMVRFEANDGAQKRSGVKSMLRAALLRLLYARTARALYIGARAKQHYLRHGLARNKLTFSPYCVDVSHCQLDPIEIARARARVRDAYSISTTDSVALFAGKLSARKGVREWVEAALQLPSDVKNSLILAFVGAGELAAELRAQLSLDGAPRSIFFGFVNQTGLSEIYAASDFGVLPSIAGETWGLVVNESLHHGRPVLVTDTVGSSVDLVIEGSTGAIANPTPASLARACLRVLAICQDPLTFQRCRTQVERYSVRAAAQGIAQGYRQLVPEGNDALPADRPELSGMPRVALLGEFGGTNLAGSIQHALLGMGIAPIVFRSRDAYTNSIRQKVLYRLHRRPLKLNAFAQDLAQTCIDAEIDLLITTGICPLTAAAAERMAAKGIVIVNWLSDDPWNQAYTNDYFIPALKHMSVVFSPRHANMAQLNASGAARVVYLPFAADQRFFSPKPYATLDEIEGDIDLLFVGGADAERRKTLLDAAHSELKIALYGGYWDQIARYKKFMLGIAAPEEINIATQKAKVCLILVRRANRDGHVMRSLEAAASGACLLVEHTPEHEALFGADGECVQYFYADTEILVKTKVLLANPLERHRLRQNIVQKMRATEHDYAARVREMLRVALPKFTPAA